MLVETSQTGKHRALKCELEAAEERARHLAEHDLLTDLPNRARTLQQLNLLLESTRHTHEQIGLLYVDLDRFNNVNDSMGNEAGDRLLQTVAQRMRSMLRHTDVVSRVSADEFIVVLPELRNRTDAAGVAHVLLDAIRRPITLNDQEVSVTASIGISISPGDGANGDELVRNAVAAMYVAKQSAPGTYEFYAPSINAAAPRKLQIENELRIALEREQLQLHFQPQVDLRTGAVTAAEALVRWNRPGFGLVPPSDFLPIAEERGLMVPLGRWVLKEAISQMKAWETLGLRVERVAVNVTAFELHRADFATEVTNVLASHGLEARRLEIELTESSAVRDFESTRTSLEALHSMGVTLSLDDFGTGFSSLSYLHRLPVDRLKIDQAFIRGLTPESHSMRIVRAVIGLARSFSLRVIAEGVETRQQSALLAAEGCDEIQGFVTSRPLPAPQFQRLLQSSQQQHRAIVCSPTARRA